MNCSQTGAILPGEEVVVLAVVDQGILLAV